MRSLAIVAGLTTASAALGACTPEAKMAEGQGLDAAFSPEYQGVEASPLADDLVVFRLAMTGARDTSDVEAYGRCAAAQFALVRGDGFAQHVRTTVTRDGDNWRGDAAYLISAALPPGPRNIDAEVAVSNCEELGIPTA